MGRKGGKIGWLARASRVLTSRPKAPAPRRLGTGEAIDARPNSCAYTASAAASQLACRRRRRPILTFSSHVDRSVDRPSGRARDFRDTVDDVGCSVELNIVRVRIARGNMTIPIKIASVCCLLLVVS